MPSFDGGDNFVWIGDPFEGFGMGVVIVEETIDRGLEVGDGSENAVFQAAFDEGCEETLNGVEPGGRGRGEVEGPSRIARQPLAHDRMLVSSVIVEDGVDGLASGDLALNCVEKANELLVSMALHVAADHGSIEDVHRRKQSRRPVPLVVVGHGSGAAFFDRQAGLGAVEGLDLALFVDREDDGMRRRIDIEADHVAQLVDEFGILGELELPNAVGCSPCARQMRWTELTLTRAASAMATPVQCVVSPGGACIVRVTTRSAIEGSSLEMREGRVLSRRRPSKPWSAKRSCQRQTQVLDLPVSRMIALVPTPSAVSSTICARQTCFCDALRSLTRARSRALSANVTEREMPVRIRQTRTPRVPAES